MEIADPKWCANRSVNSSTRIDQWLWKSALRDSEDPFDGRRYLREARQPVCPRNGQTSTDRDSSAIIMAGREGHKLTGIIGLISAPTSTVISVKREIS